MRVRTLSLSLIFCWAGIFFSAHSYEAPSIPQKILASCREKGTPSIFIEVEIWSENDQLWFVKFMNHIGGKRSQMDISPILSKRLKGVMEYKNQDESLRVPDATETSVLSENIMGSTYETQLECHS